MAKQAPYGTWTSPITADLILGESVFGSTPHLELDGGVPYWEESRPAEGGRTTVVTSRDGAVVEVTPAPHDVRSRVHSSGGGAFTVADGTLYFSNKHDDRIYRLPKDGEPEAITPVADVRYADLVVDDAGGRLLAIREDHRTDGEAVATIVGIDLSAPHDIAVLAEGHDFFAAPTPGPDGRLAYIAWNHPDMPWDETILYVRDGDATRVIASGASIAEPRWAPDGSLHYVDDRTGYWNLYRDGVRYGPERAEFTRPHWIFGTRCYGFRRDSTVVAAFVAHGTWRIATIDPTSGAFEALDQPYDEVFRLKCDGQATYAVVGGADRPRAVVRIHDDGRLESIREEIDLELDSALLSAPESITFERDGVMAYADFYPPRSADFEGPPDTKPPLIVLGHGGPTSSAGRCLDLAGVQFWTTRGFAVTKVDYRGSTGYGTAYRRALHGGWGDYDVADCVNAARHLADSGRVDGDRMAIVGRSAGGLTVLSALAFYDVFRCGVSHYGISDLELLAEETHKFESRYMDRLIAPFAENRELYRARSPIHHVERISSPVLFFQGRDDTVVPANQAELMVERLRSVGVEVSHFAFAGEGHGFRRGDTRRAVLREQLSFFRRWLCSGD